MSVPSGEPAIDVEAEVLRALTRGEQRRALVLLMDAHGVAIYRFCLQMLRDKTLAEDAQQTVFVHAFSGLSEFDRRSSLRTWLFSIARHRCLDLIKAERRRRKRFVLVERPPEPTPPPRRPDEGPDEGIDMRQLHARLERCLDRLAPDARSAVLLRFHHELRFEQMAAVCGASAGTLQARVARAMATLRRCLAASRGIDAV
jgi:RNA polymerase sigma-70 factor (ECF subfamily)